MDHIALTYRQWMDVHPTFRSIIDRVPHVVAYDEGELRLARVRLIRATSYAAHVRCNGQLRLRGA